jgi:hypothetical protein
VNTRKRIFHTVIETFLSYGWETWTLDYKLGNNVKYRTEFLEKCWKDLQTTLYELEKNGSNKNNFGEGGLQHVGMVWTRSTHGGEQMA